MTVGLAALVFLSLALFGYAAATGLSAQQKKRHAFRERFSAMTGWVAETLRPPVLKDDRLSRIDILNALLFRLSIARGLRRTVLQAGVRKRVGEIILYVPLLASTAFLFTIVMSGGILLGTIAAVAAGAVPFLVLSRMRRKRAGLFAEQLPDALDLMRSALQAGHGLVGSFTIIADEFPDPIASEFREVAEEMRLGLPMRDALMHLTERIDNPDTPLLAVGLLVAQDVGGNLAEVLDNISYTIRERFKLLRDVRVLTAQGRLSGMVLTVLPFLLGLILFTVSPEYMAPVFSDPIGHWMIAYVILSVTAGHLVMRRILAFKV